VQYFTQAGIYLAARSVSPLGTLGTAQRFPAMAKGANSIPMAIQPVRPSGVHRMAESASAKRPTARLNNTSSAKSDHLRQNSLKKQRSLLAGGGKNKRTGAF
jgi:hypothetical protein